MAKKYITPTCVVVTIKSNDIITDSGNRSVAGNVFNGDITGSNEPGRAPGYPFDEWYEGY